MVDYMPNGYMRLLAEETAARTFTVDGPLKSITFEFLGKEWVVSESVVVQWVVMVVLAIFFFVLGLIFVYRSFYSMRI